MKYQFYEYVVEYYYNISSLDKSIKNKILNHLEKVNNSSTRLSYGIFDKNLNQKQKIDLLEKMAISLMFLGDEEVGFAYQYIFNTQISQKPVVHLGLMVANKNTGRDLTFINKIAYKFLYEKIGHFYSSSLASAPFLIGEFSRILTNVWPSPYSSKQKLPPSKEHKQIAQECFSQYVLSFFPFPEHLELDSKRFVLISKAQEMGFEVDMRKMQRDDDLMVNLFSMFWLDYEKQEVLLQVGEYDQKAYDEFNKIYDQLPIKIVSLD